MYLLCGGCCWRRCLYWYRPQPISSQGSSTKLLQFLLQFCHRQSVGFWRLPEVMFKDWPDRTLMRAGYGPARWPEHRANGLIMSCCTQVIRLGINDPQPLPNNATTDESTMNKWQVRLFVVTSHIVRCIDLFLTGWYMKQANKTGMATPILQLGDLLMLAVHSRIAHSRPASKSYCTYRSWGCFRWHDWTGDIK